MKKTYPVEGTKGGDVAENQMGRRAGNLTELDTSFK